MKNTPYILIPAYEPGETLVELVRALHIAGLSNIIVVNDGSGKNADPIFQSIAAHVILLKHEYNQGKGAALKTGLAYIQSNAIDQPVITVDADGQHLVKDVLHIAEALEQHPDQLVLGVRQFSKNIPWRSRFGNELSRKVFRLLYKYDLEDTQTGLRGIPISLQQQFLTIDYNHYEFESECLIMAIKVHANICQIPIETVYLNHNESSHFNPLIDSLKIYYVFFRYCLIALLSFCIDFAIFACLHLLTHTIFFSLICARLCSSSFNFYQNKFRVYRSHDRATLLREVWQYILLAISVFFASYYFIVLLTKYAHCPVLIAKLIVDAVLFIVNFIIQKAFIFNIE